MESTSNYCFLLLYLLDKAEITASLVNPKKIKNYSRKMMSVTKNDDMNARLIADYGEKMKPAPYKLPSESLMLLKQKKTVFHQLQKQLTATKNLQSSLEPLPVKDKKCHALLKQTITFLEKQIKHVEAELVQTAEHVFAKQLKALTSIKGSGVTLATALIIVSGDSPTLTMPSSFHVISVSVRPLNNSAPASISEDISTETEMKISDRCYMSRHGRQANTTRLAKSVTNDCVNAANLENSP